MFIAMNRFRVALGSETEFEQVWLSRDVHLRTVPGFERFHLLRGPEYEDHVLYASHTVWRSEEDFAAWTRSDAFRQAHSRRRSEHRAFALSRSAAVRGFRGAADRRSGSAGVMTIRIDRVVTRGGDLGLTSLGDGSRVSKDSVRVEAYGTVDEANASLGVLRATLEPGSSPDRFLRWVQNMLFDVGADLCVPGAAGAALRLGDEPVLVIETAIGELLEHQEKLDSFILPAGSLAAASAHLARTIMRRAERRVVTLAASEPVTPSVIRLLNRLSDYLFVLSRHLNGDGRADVLWERGAQLASSD